MKRIITLIIGLLPIFLFGQIPVGQFRVHIPLHAFHSVAVAETTMSMPPPPTA